MRSGHTNKRGMYMTFYSPSFKIQHPELFKECFLINYPKQKMKTSRI